jgi:hypothetical protein
MAAPPNYSSDSTLPQPSVPVEMKVFHGGGSSDSLLPQPSTPVPMSEFRGGGRKQIGGNRPESVKGEPLPFRLTPFTEISHLSLLENSDYFLVKLVSKNTPNLKEETFGSKPVIPVVLTENGTFSYLKGSSIDLKNTKLLGISSLTPDFLGTAQKGNLYIFFRSKKFKGSNPIFQEVESFSTIPQTPISEKKSQNQSLVTLSSGHRVRYVDDSIQESIKSLEFVEDEERLFQQIFITTPSFAKKYCREHPEEFYRFWKLYVNYDGTSIFQYMTMKESQILQTFFRQFLDAYREFLLQESSSFLNSLQSDFPSQTFSKESPLQSRETQTNTLQTESPPTQEQPPPESPPEQPSAEKSPAEQTPPEQSPEEDDEEEPQENIPLDEKQIKEQTSDLAKIIYTQLYPSRPNIYPETRIMNILSGLIKYKHIILSLFDNKLPILTLLPDWDGKDKIKKDKITPTQFMNRFSAEKRGGKQLKTIDILQNIILVDLDTLRKYHTVSKRSFATDTQINEFKKFFRELLKVGKTQDKTQVEIFIDRKVTKPEQMQQRTPMMPQRKPMPQRTPMRQRGGFRNQISDVQSSSSPQSRTTRKARSKQIK